MADGLTTIVVTMAGRGQRFRDAGYSAPKFMVPVRGRSLFAWSLDSLRAFFPVTAQIVFVTRREDAAHEFIRREAASLGLPSHAVVELEATTDGQATTVLRAAADVADPGRPLLVYNIDTHVRPGAMHPAQVRGAGWVPCFPGEGDKWSFVRADAEDRALELREKKRISPHATVGAYWFCSLARFADCYERHFATAGVERGERYIAPMYNTLIADGGAVYISHLPAGDVVPLGTPEDVEAFARG